MSLENLSALTDRDGVFRVVIETPRGCRNKYAHDPELGAMVLKKVLPEGHVFPFDFGFIPQTKGGDGDPLDVLVLMDEPAFPGCVLTCRIIGVLQIEESEKGKKERNDRYIAVAEDALHYRRVKELRDLGADVVGQIRHFFISYAEMGGKKLRVLRTLGAKAAQRTVVEAVGSEK